MSDGRIWFNTKIDNSTAEKNLRDLKRKIQKSTEDISKAQAAKLPLEKQLDSANAKLNEAKNNLLSLQSDLAAAREAMEPGSAPEDFLRAKADIPRYEAAITETEKEIATLQKQWDQTNAKVQKYDDIIKRANTDIGRNSAAAAQLGSQFQYSGSKMKNAFTKAADSAKKFEKRIISLAKRAFIFSVISSGLRKIKEYMSASFKTNQEYVDQLAKLKGALLTAFQPIYEYILPGVIMVLKVLTTIVQVVAYVLSALSGKTAKESAASAKALYEEIAALNGVKAAADAAKKSLAGFDEINRLSAPDSGSTGASSAITPDFSGIGDISVDMEEIMKWVSSIGAGLLTWKVAGMFITSLSKVAGLVAIIGGGIFYSFEWANAFENGIDWENLSGMLVSMIAVVGGLTLAFGSTAGAIGLLVTSVGLIVLALKEWIETGTLSDEACATLIVGILGIGAAISILTGNWIPMLIAAVVSLVISVVQYGEEIKAALEDVAEWIKGIFVRDWREVFGTVLGSELNHFTAKLVIYIDGIKQELNGLIDFIGGVFTNDWDRVLGGLNDITDGKLNAFIGMLNFVIRSTVEGVNKLFRLLSFDINLPGGKSYKIEMPQIENVPQIPYLARGAVLPANNPFLAVVGDQKHGTNVEAPLSTIQEAVAIVMGDMTGGMMAGFEANQAVLQAILEAIYEIDTSDERYAQAVDNFNRKMAVVRGG